MSLIEFLEEMQAKYGDGVLVKRNNEGKEIPENLPQPLKEFYQDYDYAEFPFGEIYPLHVALKEEEPFKSEGWLCFGFDGYFSYWLCKKEAHDGGDIFTSWDHEVDDEIEGTHDDFVEFLTDMEMDYEPECQVILIKPLTDKKLAAKIKKDFASPLSIGEFVKSCNAVPFVISNDLAYKTALQMISDNKEYGDYIKVELV